MVVCDNAKSFPVAVHCHLPRCAWAPAQGRRRVGRRQIWEDAKLARANWEYRGDDVLEQLACSGRNNSLDHRAGHNLDSSLTDLLSDHGPGALQEDL